MKLEKLKYAFIVFWLLSVCQIKSQIYYPGMPLCTNICNNMLPFDGVLSVYTPEKTEFCVNEQITFNYIGTICASDNINMGDCQSTEFSAVIASPAVGYNFVFSYSQPGTYTVAVVEATSNCYFTYLPITIVDCGPADNTNCLKTFAPTAGTYMLSYWVKEERPANFLATNTTYVSGIDVKLNSTTTPYYANGAFNSANKIIEGWQKVDAVITIPPGTTSIDIKLRNNSPVDAYFDDIRFHPFNSAFKSYVYDPVTLRLIAELDDRNYATLYEYDEEGKLIRVKKETERGIKTIKESRTSIKK